MNITATKTDAANVSVVATIDAADIEKNLNKAAKQIAKTASVDGFRKGKVPVAKVKQMYADQLQQDAENQAVQDILEQAKKELDINASDIISDPTFKKYDKAEGNIETELVISLRPTVEAEGYKDLAPSYDEPTVDDAEIEEKLKALLAANAPYTSLKRKRALKKDDQANFDFVGKIDGVEFDGGKAEGFELVIGSGQFIPGFEDQMEEMKIEETKDITVTFPEDYQSDELKGKEAVFTVTLNDIKEKSEPELDEEMIKKLIPNEEGATADTVKEKIAEQVKSEKVSKLYNETLKPALIEALVEKYNFALPQNIVDQEIDAQINNKAKEMSEDELASYKDNEEKINELRESVRETATNSVKATFLVDYLAKEEGVEVNDQEVSQTIYYEAMMSGQDPQEVIKYYQENNLLPAVKMGMIEDKLFAKIIGIEQ
ncbi:MAG: Cell division trigger factor (EC [uncultured Sulfurovum sp.]|uniref:Trigger factor n=1 Tax=uncultured Sulfurovum sp. TaxID=269237 RepID=A0A6S6U0H3_9BACT|nr:MAG: Cell division trigger factor (EC [uncultured Sulfurovum sp.]